MFELFNQGINLGIKETAANALASAATAIGATAGSASSVHASKVAQQVQEQLDEYKRACLAYRDLALHCARSVVCVNVVACVGEDSHDGGAYLDTTLLGEVSE